jgi:hypothetical protein
MPNIDSTERDNKNPPENIVRVLAECCHMALDSLFIKTEDGCIVKCANCKKIIVRHCPCTTDKTSRAKDGGLMISLPCDTMKMKESEDPKMTKTTRRSFIPQVNRLFPKR